jgi:phosphatidylinositol glycan class B
VVVEGRLVLAAGLLLGLAVRLRLAVTDDSVYWPDQVHKTIEAGHRAAFGYGWQPWEYVHGAVSWTIGGMFAAVLWALAGLGLDDPHRYVVVVRTLVAVASMLASWAVYRAVRDWGGAELPAAVASMLSALAAPVLYFSHRPLSETLSLAPVTFGVWLTLRPARRPRLDAVGAALLALSVLLRLQNGLVCLTVLAVLALRRDWRRLRPVALVLAAGAALYGAVDWLTWGVPFHSPWEYGRWTFGKGVAEAFGESPFPYYLRFLFLSIGPVSVVLLGLAVAAAWRAPGLVAVPGVFLLAHSIEGHKEARFVLVAVPLLCMAVGIGLDQLGRRWRPVVAVLVLAPVAYQAVTIERLTMRDIGQDHMFAASASAFAHSGEVNRLLFAAHRRADLCGLRVAVLEAAWSGGYTYLHRNVPFYDKWVPEARAAGHYNYEIVVRDPTDPRFVASDGGYGLRRVGDRCRPDPAFSSRFGDPETRR